MSQPALPLLPVALELVADTSDTSTGTAGTAGTVPAAAPAPGSSSRRRLARRLRGVEPEAGMATAEYAVATVAACGFGAVLIKAITDERVLGLIVNVISKALRLGLG